jgi:hypothetical protein
MSQKRIALLAALLAAGGMILMAGCTKANHDPIITSITVTPDDNVVVGSNITLTAVATDEDGDALTYEWTVTGGGTLSQSTTNTVVWTAPAAEGNATVTCKVSDGHAAEATLAKTVYATVVWQFADVQGYTPDSAGLPANATTFVLFEMEDPIPNNAIIDSVFITTDLEPDELYGEYFQVIAVSPSGSEVIVYDGLNGEPDVDGLLLQGIKGELAKGNWRLKVVRPNSADERWCEECELDLYYRYY